MAADYTIKSLFEQVMALLRIQTNPSSHQLKIFAAAWLVFLTALGGGMLARGASLAGPLMLWALAAAVPAAGWVSPRFLRAVYVAMSCLGYPVGFVVSHCILAAVYYFVLTPLALALRAAGHDPLDRRFDRKAESYWVKRPADEAVERHFRQF